MAYFMREAKPMAEPPQHWLNRERLTDYPRICLVVLLLTAIVWVAISENGIDSQGKPLGYDFITFWGASHLALEGNPVGAYDPETILGAERLAVPENTKIFLWHYPPTFYLVILPLALLPYGLAFLLFIGASFAGYLVVIRRIVSLPGTWMPLIAFPGAMMNIFHGQNAFLTAALMGGALLLLPLRPVLAGVLIGLLTIKPHLGILLPLVLLATCQWRALLSALFTTSFFLLVSVAVMGQDTLVAFWHNMPLVRRVLEEGLLSWSKMPTFFAFARLLDAPIWAAYALHLLVAVAVTGCVLWVWLNTTQANLRNAALVTGTLLISPYLFDYDLAWLGLSIAWLGLEGYRKGWLTGEREILVAAWFMPLLMAPIAGVIHIQMAPFVLLALLGAIVNRVNYNGA